MKTRIILTALLFLLLGPAFAQAHFGMVIPSASTIMESSQAEMSAIIAFAHPFAAQGMTMEKPQSVFLEGPKGRLNLTDALEPTKFMGKEAWQVKFRPAQPGVWQLAVIPEPYYESSEESFIIHYTKTVIGAFGGEDDWDRPLGLPMEIVPLVRPFANYAGNLFSGTVLQNGKALPGAPVEVEFLNQSGTASAPNPYFETQVLHTDQNGNFSFSIPWAGWWGFAALADSPQKLEKDGKEMNVETGAVIWLKFVQPQIGAGAH